MKSYFSPKEWGLLISLIIHLILVLYLASNRTERASKIEQDFISLNFEESPIPEEEKQREKLKPLVPVPELSNMASQRNPESENKEYTESQNPAEQQEDLVDSEMLMDKLLDKYGAKDVKIKTNKKKPIERRITKDGVELVDPYTGESNIHYTLPGRMDEGIPNPIYLCEGGGRVTVRIVVDWQGNVTRAEVIKTKSVQYRHCLYEQAVSAALNSKFNSYQFFKNPELGTITFFFKRQ